MDIRDAADSIRESVSMAEILDYYGYSAKNGKMLCPFHADKNESFKLYQNAGWYCFGCCKGGSVIDFVMEHEGCMFIDAVKAIDKAFNLDLLEPEDPLKQDSRRAYRRIVDRLKGILYEQIDVVEKIIDVELTAATQAMLELSSKKELSVQDWTELMQIETEMEYMEYKLQKCGELRKEVTEWQKTRLKERPKKA